LVLGSIFSGSHKEFTIRPKTSTDFFKILVFLVSSWIKFQLINNPISINKPMLDGLSDIADHLKAPAHRVALPGKVFSSTSCPLTPPEKRGLQGAFRPMFHSISLVEGMSRFTRS
jgi:hypothetical protein